MAYNLPLPLTLRDMLGPQRKQIVNIWKDALLKNADFQPLTSADETEIDLFAAKTLDLLQALLNK
ncbi:MAG: hypothetical protein WC838_07165, partial [Candidatus Margulisiibacteriota bacterium]